MDAHKSRTSGIPNGWFGGGLDISPGIGMMYSASYHSGQTYLDVVALMHHRHVYSDRGSPPVIPPPPLGAVGGSGASIGPYMVICHCVNGQNELHSEGQCLMQMEDSNVVLLEQAGRVPRVVSTHRIDDDLNGVAQWAILGLLRERLYGLQAVRRFISA